MTRATLFHVKPYWVRAAEFGGINPDTQKIEQMDLYADWLRREGVIAGGIGPAESSRIDLRHLADSILFVSQLPVATGEVWDLGSGVGLPGIPMAICLPEVEFVLIDRSGRRVDLMKRAIRVLGLRNCSVVQRDIHELDGQTRVLVSRASLPPDRLTDLVRPLLAPDGIAIVAGSWEQTPDQPDWEVREIPADVLDRTVWLLIMRRE